MFRKLSQHLNFDSPFLIKAARLNFALSEGRDKESRERPERLIAQIMDIGEWEDECELEETFSDEVLRHIPLTCVVTCRYAVSDPLGIARQCDLDKSDICRERSCAWFIKVSSNQLHCC